MNQFRTWMARFMQGRYGPDQLYRGLLVVFFVCVVLNLFVPSNIFYFISLAVFGISTFRVFSRNIAARSQENQRYILWRDTAKKKALLLRNRVRDYKTHRYRPCPNCKTTLRLKRQVGTVHVRCPKCSTEFDITMKR